MDPIRRPVILGRGAAAMALPAIAQEGAGLAELAASEQAQVAEWAGPIKADNLRLE